ncbi:MAG: ATP-binding protein [Gammaproteobacteria bacterium]|nr:ATP-binding protein [Gammaproteobacteria bacterium]
MMNSLQARLLVLAGLLLVVFVGGAGITLERGAAEAARAGVRKNQMGVMYGLLAAAEYEPGGLVSIPRLPEPRLGQPDSGLYATVVDSNGAILWRSPSAETESLLAVPSLPPPGVFRFEYRKQQDLFRLNYGVLWEGIDGDEQYLGLEVLQNSELYAQTLASFRRTLWSWLGVLGVLLLLLQTALLRWGLAPLRQVSHAVSQVEKGEQAEVVGRYPRELAHLTDNLNRLIRSDRARFERQRNALGDLSHSLKTPLSVLNGAVDRDTSEQLVNTVREQTARMDAIVQHQLRRATLGNRGIGRTVPVAPAAARVVSALSTVYTEKSVRCERDVPTSLHFPGDEGDLMELLGNLLDNAFKCCRERVRLSAGLESGAFQLRVEDDGPGIAPSDRSLIGSRGVRLDERRPGNGIGLAVVQEIVKAYGGDLEIGESNLGGARVCLTIGLANLT